MILATSRTLRRIGRDGRDMWRLMPHTEARAVNVSSDGRLVVAGMGDGSIRWYRAADGELLATLLVLRDRRWIAWAESGHFDADPAADELIGWLVTPSVGATAGAADIHLTPRLRERYRRPDILARVLTDGDLRATLERSDPPRQTPAPAPTGNGGEANNNTTVAPTIVSVRAPFDKTVVTTHLLGCPRTTRSTRKTFRGIDGIDHEAQQPPRDSNDAA